MYYVYRFKDKKDNILYVGRTKDLYKRFLNHEHLNKDTVYKIEYIECSSEAEMVWKEIYYINLYYNKLSKNTADVYNNEVMQDIGLKDKWVEYTYYSNIIENDCNIEHLYKKYVLETKIENINYSKLITIIDHKKLNMIGDNMYSLSEKWFRDYPDQVKQLKNNIMNYYTNIIKDENKSKKCLWTTYIQYYDELKGKGYTKGFCHTSKEQQSEYKDRIYLAYLENNFMNNGQLVNLTQDQYALTYLLRFIFKSGIRDGKRITVYIPSKRMRSLLENWIDEQRYENEYIYKEEKYEGNF